MSGLDNIYSKLPVWGQQLAVSVFGLYWYWMRFGPGYKHNLRAYQDRESFNTESWRSWQESQLKTLLTNAAFKIPYYQKVWSKEEKSAAMAGKLSDLPLLEKEHIRADPEAFIRRDLQMRPRMVFPTSGSSGTPISSIWSVGELRQSLALREIRSARWAGVSFKLPRATFSGRLVEPDPNSQGPYYRFNMIERQVYFSAFHLRSNTASIYVDALHKHNIQWLTGYAVSFYLLATFILDQNLKVPSLKALITTSEKLTEQMRLVMEQAYKCKVYEEYSTVENVIFASECEQGGLHVSPDVSIVEIIRPDGTPCLPGEVGEVVTTNLMRTYQPLIRFRLGDLAAWELDPCPCGRSMPMLKDVVGRIEDVVIGPDGRQMVRFHGVFINQPHIREGQVIQDSLHHIHVKIVPAGEFSVEDEMDVIQRVKDRLGAGVRVSVEVVSAIPRTSAGKFRAVICNLSEDERASIG